MAVYSSSTVSSKSATYYTTIHIFEDLKVLWDGYRMVMFDGRRRRSSVKKIWNEDGMEGVSAPLRIRYKFFVAGAVILSAQAIKLSKFTNIFTATVRHKAICIDTMQCLLRYAREFKEDYEVRFVDVSIIEIMKDTMLSNIFCANSRET